MGSSDLFVGKIEARAYSRATEIEERVVSAVLNLIPESLRNDQPVLITKTEGQSGDRILVVELIEERRKMCGLILDHLFSRFSDSDRLWIMSSIEQRLDDQCTLFLRIDKQAAYLGRIESASGPDVISVQIHLRDYPRCERARAKEFIEERLLVGEE